MPCRSGHGKPRRAFARTAALAALAWLPALAADGAEEALSVCFAENDPPRSERGESRGFDIDVARLLAGALARPLRLVWLAERGQTDIESSDADYRYLLSGQCDLQLSVPGQEAIAAWGGRLALSEPYYGAAFELLPADSSFSWGGPFNGRIAVRSNSVAHVAVDAAGIPWTMQASTAAIVSAVASGAAQAALVWGPNLALLDAKPPLKASERFQPPEVLRWNLHAVARLDDTLLGEANRVFAQPASKGEINRLLKLHGLPPRAPFATVHSREALRQVREQ